MNYTNLLKILICFSLVSKWLTIEAQNTDFQYNTFIFENKSLPYRLLSPENIKENKRYPLVIFLHGSGERGIDNEKQLVHGSKLFLQTETRKQFPAYVVFPQCPDGERWGNLNFDRGEITWNDDPSEYGKMVMELIAQLTDSLPIESRKIYIGGLSMGGMGTFDLVSHYPEFFAAAFPICGGANPKLYDKLSQTPLWIFHGDADVVVPVSWSRAIVAALPNHKKLKYSEYPGVNHNSWDYAFAEPDLLKWIFKQKRKSPKK